MAYWDHYRVPRQANTGKKVADSQYSCILSRQLQSVNTTANSWRPLQKWLFLSYSEMMTVLNQSGNNTFAWLSGKDPREIPRSSPASPRKTLSIPPLLLGFTQYCPVHSRQSNSGLYWPSRKLFCGTTRNYTCQESNTRTVNFPYLVFWKLIL